VLKTLGATRGRLLGALVMEYALLGAATGSVRRAGGRRRGAGRRDEGDEARFRLALAANPRRRPARRWR
jgi:hypothetical protein